MDTKDRILETALALYNKKGINATTRHIATEMGISAGNLHYHFKHTDDIILALWQRLVASFDGLINSFRETSDFDFPVVQNFVIQSFRITNSYRFIFLHFVELGNRLPSIRKEYNKLVKKREEEFGQIFQSLNEAGMLKMKIPDEMLPVFVKQLFIVSDFWLSNNELTSRLKGKKAEEAYLRQMEVVLWPYYG